MNLQRKIERNLLKKTKNRDQKGKDFNQIWKGWKEYKKQKTNNEE